MCRSEHVPIPSLSPGGTACSRQKGGSVTQDEQIGSTYNAPTGLKYGAWAVLRTTHMPLLRSYGATIRTVATVQKVFDLLKFYDCCPSG